MHQQDDNHHVGLSSVLLVPGFLSPAWTLFPLQRSLVRQGYSCSIWDDPFVGRDLDRSLRRLASNIATRSREAGVSIVAHSFGDWLVRSCLQEQSGLAIQHLVSIGPVTTAVPAAKLAKTCGLGGMSEIQVMADPQRAEVELAIGSCTRRTVIWPKLEFIVRRKEPLGKVPTETLTVRGTHVSVLFQPAVHRMVGKALRTRAS